MAQTHESHNIHGAPPPYTEDPKMAYSRGSNAGLEPNLAGRPASRHSSVASDTSRPALDTTQYPKPARPIGEAVEHAFDQAHVNSIPPHLIAQITQNVISELNKHPDTKTKFQQPPAPQAPHSPPSTQASPPPTTRDVYTPPSPHKHGEYPTSMGSPESRASTSANVPHSPTKDRPSSRLSSVSGEPSSRPGTAEETTLERIWGKCFEDGKPTKRLGQFLRGIAVHIIESYEPKDSLVITPEKMEQFYKEMKIEKEVYPWTVVFDDESSSISRMYRQLECKHHLVQEENHFYEKPDIPGLTPQGFELWQTMLIQAHPEEEFQRLQKAACQLPINNPDDKKERFPKDISRRLFPAIPDLKVRHQLVHAIEQHCHCTIARDSRDPKPSYQPERDSSRSPPRSDPGVPFQSESPPRSQENNGIERQRNPYSTSGRERVIDDLSLPTQTKSKPIERERQPYRAAPGRRPFEDERLVPETRAPESRLPPEAKTPTPSQPLNQSGHPSSGPPPSNNAPFKRNNSVAQSRPINIPPPPVGNPRGPPPPASADFFESYHQGMPRRQSFSRRRAPSPSSEWGARSESDLRSSGFQPGSYERHQDEDRRGFGGRGPSPGRRVERADTLLDPRERGPGDRRSMYDTGEEYYRARASTVSGRGW